MIQLVYLSSARRLFTAEDISSILTSSLRNNARDEITGILLYRSGSVLQLLEGDDLAVHWLYEVIKRDERHHRVTLLYDIPVTQRDFLGWAMAYRDLDVAPVSRLQGYSPLMEENFDMSTVQPERARQILALFRSGIR